MKRLITWLCRLPQKVPHATSGQKCTTKEPNEPMAYEEWATEFRVGEATRFPVDSEPSSIVQALEA